MKSFRTYYNIYEQFIQPLVITLVTVGCIWFGIIPAGKYIYSQYQVMTKLTRDNDQMKRKLTVLSSMDSETLEHAISVLFRAVPVDKSAETLISSVEYAAGQSGMTISSLSIGAIGSLSTSSATLSEANKESGNKGTDVSLKMTLAGSLDSFLTFVEKTQQVPRLLTVSSFSLKTATSSGKIGIDLKGYSSPLPKISKNADNAIVRISSDEETVIERLSSFATISIPEIVPSAVSGKENPFSL